MATELSDYLRSLEPDRELTAEAYEGAREGLRRLLFKELCRRGLWGAPPRYLGVLGEHWPGEAIDELVSECYVAIFVDRLKRLKDRARVGDAVGGLIVCCVRNFVQDRQQRNDPLGYKLYKLVSAGLQRLTDAGKLRLVPGGKVLNDTICAFGAAPDVVREVDLEVQVRALNDDLCLELIVAQGRARSGLEERLDEHLAGLATTAEAFYFRDLIEPLKRDARARWREGVAAEVAGWAALATAHDLDDLRKCVQRRIDQEHPKDREGLHRLWAFLCDYAAGTNPSPVAEKAEKSGRPPTALGLEKVLGDSRHRISGFKKKLGMMIDQCRSTVPGKGSVKSRVEVGFAHMERHNELRNATLRALSSWSAERADIDAAPRSPRPGDTFVFPGSGDQLVEWLVVEEGADGRWLVVAVDDRPGVGSQDVALHPPVSGLASVRCVVEARLHNAAFEPAQRTGMLTDDVLGQVLEKRASVADGSIVASPAEREVDDDPDYLSCMAELGQLQNVFTQVAGSAGTVKEKPLLRSPRWWPGRPYGRIFALAAMLVLSLGTAVVWQQIRITALQGQLRDAPYANLPFVWLTADENIRGPEDPLVVPAEARRLAFILEVSTPRSYPRYRVELLSKDPRLEVWSQDSFIKTESELSFDLPSSLLADSEYEIGIYGLPEKGEPALLESYSLWIRLEE